MEISWSSAYCSIMANFVKKQVSRNKKRFTETGFNLDLSYITSSVIAMGFPAEKLEGVYRNHIDDVVRFFAERHPGHYKIYNLCNEREYDYGRFACEIVSYPFQDHNAPPFETMLKLCEDVQNYLKEDKDNVVAIHCKAGKGRTGVMICAYLVYSKQFEWTSEALEFYAKQRTNNNKGVTIPSQIRYIYYFRQYMYRPKSAPTYKQTVLLFSAVRFEGVPTMTNGSSSPFYVVYANDVEVVRSNCFEVPRQTSEIDLPLERPVPIQGDVKVEFFHKSMVKRERMFHCWFNTYFVIHPTAPEELPEHEQTMLRRGASNASRSHAPTGRAACVHVDGDDSLGSGSRHQYFLTFSKMELDKAHKDTANRLFPQDFKVTFFFYCYNCPGCQSHPDTDSVDTSVEMRRGCVESPPSPRFSLNRQGYIDQTSIETASDLESNDGLTDTDTEYEEPCDSELPLRPTNSMPNFLQRTDSSRRSGRRAESKKWVKKPAKPHESKI